MRLLLTSGSPTAQVTFTLGKFTNKVATTAMMNRNSWTPVVLRNTAVADPNESSITGSVVVQTLGTNSNDVGALFSIDGLQLNEGSFPADFVGPNQIRKGGEVSWMVGD